MAGSYWTSFTHDPRRPENARLRASERDRETVAELLSTSYAEGRLDRQELDDRLETLARTRTLGQLTPLVADLVSGAYPGPGGLWQRDYREEAERRYRKLREQALWGFLGPTLICWVVWGATMPGGFPWPAIVMAATSIRFLQLAVSHGETVRSIEDSLQRRDRRRLEARDRRRRALGRGRYP